MNKLSELSKPVAWVLHTRGGDVPTLDECYVANAEGMENIRSSALYSQEYVSALLAELEVSRKSNAFLKEQLSKLANFNPDWDMLEACRESWREVAAALKEAEANLEAKNKRIAELEAIRSDASQVFKEIGNELGCNPDNESIMMAIDDLKERERRVVALAGGNADLWETMAARLEAAEAKLAAPVRLKKVDSSNVPFAGDSFNAAVDYCAKAVRAAGFTVDGDE